MEKITKQTIDGMRHVNHIFDNGYGVSICEDDDDQDSFTMFKQRGHKRQYFGDEFDEGSGVECDDFYKFLKKLDRNMYLGLIKKGQIAKVLKFVKSYK